MPSHSPKYKITLPSGEMVLVDSQNNLRSELKNHHHEIYNKSMKFINCRGFGTCGTCAVKISGDTTEPTAIEKWRLNFPPHKNSLEKGIRLLCQCKAKSALTIKKLEGLWGQGSE